MKEVKDKWKNMNSAAKREFSAFKKESQRTGGGGAPKTPSATSTKIIDIFGETPHFAGLSGFETGKINPTFMNTIFY